MLLAESSSSGLRKIVVYSVLYDTLQSIIMSQEEQNCTNFSFIGPSSEEQKDHKE